MKYRIALSLFLSITSLQALAYQPVNKILEAHLDEENSDHISIRTHLNEQEANQIIEFLQENGISAHKQRIKSDELYQVSDQIWDVHVFESDTVEAIILLDKEGLPIKKRSSLFEEYIKRQREDTEMDHQNVILAQQIEDDIEKMQGVISTEVLIKFVKDFQHPTPVIKAVVHIRHDGALDDPHSELANEIRKHVLDSVENLDEDHLIFVPERAIPINYTLPKIPIDKKK